jgi:solute carrier family 25 carnitine/acylcarnitine transporter 20/29
MITFTFILFGLINHSFATYEIAKKEIMKLQNIDPMQGQLSLFAIMIAGGLAGMVTWTVSIPADVLKSRYQTAPEGTYTGIWQVYRRLMNEEGISALFRGIGPALLRAFPANAACFLGLEISKRFLTFLD